MVSGRNPARNADSLDGNHIASGSHGSNKPDSSKGDEPLQVSKGNRCAHDKNHFKKPSFSGTPRRRPHVIEESKRRIQQSFRDIYHYPEFTQVFYHPIQRDRGRLRRSESIEGTIALTLSTLLHSLNLQKMAVGFYDSGNEFHYYDYGFIERSTSQHAQRIKREMKLLQEYEIIRVITLREKNHDGSWRTKEVRIEFTDKIFLMLDLVDEYLKDRETISLKFHEKQERLERNRAKKSIYRKSSFAPRKAVNSSPDQIKDLAKSMMTPSYKKPIQGRGQAIKELYSNLIAKGVTPKDAADIIRNKYPPPH